MRKLPFGRPETIVGSSPPLNPNSYSSHSTNSPPAKRSCSTMKGLFKTKPRSPPELVRHLRELLNFINRREHKKEKHREEKMSDLDKCILEMRTILYGIDGAEPVAEACAQLTMEFLKDDTVCVLIDCLPKLDLGARQNATRVITNLSRQRIDSRLIVAEYLENNMDLMNILILGYEDCEIALSYGPILRECIRCQTVARYLLESAQMKNFFYYVQNPNFEIASDAAATFKELLTRHKSTVAEFLSKNFDWFFHEYNSQLLQSTNYITRRHAVKLLGDMLLDRSNSAVMIRYVSSLDNMRILMNLLKEPNKSIQLESFHVFKLFVANQNKPPEIVGILRSNRSKLLRFLSDFNIDKEDEQFESDKAQVVQLIINLNQQADDEER